MHRIHSFKKIQCFFYFLFFKFHQCFDVIRTSSSYKWMLNCIKIWWIIMCWTRIIITICYLSLKIFFCFWHSNESILLCWFFYYIFIDIGTRTRIIIYFIKFSSLISSYSGLIWFLECFVRPECIITLVLSRSWKYFMFCNGIIFNFFFI